MDWQGLYYIFLLPLFSGYVIGSIPFGLILAYIFGYGDIRKIGSGNIGATNVLRTGNKKLAALTLFLDAAKGGVPILIYFGGFVPHFSGDMFDPSFNYFYAMIFGLGAVLGHCFPVWLKFKGGKGVATTLGIFLAVTPLAGIAACAIWLASAKITRISSLSALTALAVTPFIIWPLYYWPAALVSCIISTIVFYRHKDNIKRLMNGTEPKIGQKKNDAVSQDTQR